jgi:hypothetical protein
MIQDGVTYWGEVLYYFPTKPRIIDVELDDRPVTLIQQDAFTVLSLFSDLTLKLANPFTMSIACLSSRDASFAIFPE